MTVAMLLAAMLAAPAQSAPATVANAATITPGGPVRGAFFALSVKDARKMADWYRNQLGFRTLLEREIARQRIVAILLERDASMIELIQRDDSRPAPARADGRRSAIEIQGIFKIGLSVTDLQGLHDRLEASGADFDYHIVQPDGNPWRTFAVRDPEGNIVQFFG